MSIMNDIDPITLKSWMDAGDTLLVDIREPREHADAHIEGAELAPLRMLAVGQYKDHDRVVFHCASGRRTALAAQALAACGAREIYHLTSGIQSWARAGLDLGSVS